MANASNAYVSSVILNPEVLVHYPARFMGSLRPITATNLYYLRKLVDAGKKVVAHGAATLFHAIQQIY